MDIEKAVDGMLKKRNVILKKATEEKLMVALKDEAILKSIYLLCNDILTGDLEPFRDDIKITIVYKDNKLTYNVSL